MRIGETNVDDFAVYGMMGFGSTEKKKGMPYFEVPVNILEDKDQVTD